MHIIQQYLVCIFYQNKNKKKQDIGTLPNSNKSNKSDLNHEKVAIQYAKSYQNFVWILALYKINVKPFNTNKYNSNIDIDSPVPCFSVLVQIFTAPVSRLARTKYSRPL